MDDGIRLDAATLALLGLAAAIADADPIVLRQGIRGVLEAWTPPGWVEELILQSVLMVGWPRTLAAAAVWREESGLPAPAADHGRPDEAPEWSRLGERTCRAVYGLNYERLRANVRALHPALDEWMVQEGYGRTLSRPGLDLRRRELCTVAQCAVQAALPQLHSHLRGARNAGASRADLLAAIAAADPFLETDMRETIVDLLERVSP